jgi:hypothetical protein
MGKAKPPVKLPPMHGSGVRHGILKIATHKGLTNSLQSYSIIRR